MNDTREIYSIQDCQDIVDMLLEEELGCGECVREAIQERLRHEFKYVNWLRFKHANCPGCVCSPEECDIFYGRNEFHGTWEKIVNGKIQSCPARVNGTMFFDTGKPEEGIRHIDLADHKFNVVEILEPVREDD